MRNTAKNFDILANHGDGKKSSVLVLETNFVWFFANTRYDNI